ncbi:alkaline phosphatase family protein [Brevibacterium sp.]|uniref:phospholipase C n=1 Tax=Brevibacterium sp. TaxID=1701 RepID=UPI002811254C|nr:alkaline phosphatase family protein [Brevibacterium sp.]
MAVRTMSAWLAGTSALALAAGGVFLGLQAPQEDAQAAEATATTTPIKHVVVLFDENVSFDHYFGTYPDAANTESEKLQGGGRAGRFTASDRTPKDIDTLTANNLIKDNPNAVKPFRLTPDQAITCDQNHAYGSEQAAFNGGKMDRFVETVSKDKCTSAGSNMSDHNGMTMGYYDGNTVTGLWNYAQHYALNDNSYSTNFGPSTPGALNLISGDTSGARSYDPRTRTLTDKPDSHGVKDPDARGEGTVTGDPDPVWDDCSNNSGKSANNLVGLTGRNIGDLLSSKGVSWGWFQGGFTPSTSATDSSGAKCMTSHTNVGGNAAIDYSPHHNPFAYYKSTANQHHLSPASTGEIGHDGRANHSYDLDSFEKVVDGDNMPAVSYLKAGEYQDGHAGYSDPVDEQHFLTKYINMVQKSKNWKDTAVVVAYDDSDGWYDHRAADLTNASNDPGTDEYAVGDGKICTAAARAGVNIAGGRNGRCGPGTRQPLLVISPYSKSNFVDHTQTDQGSILQFIEENWKTGSVGGDSLDVKSNPVTNMFDFAGTPKTDSLILDEKNGEFVSDDSSVPTTPTTDTPSTPASDAPTQTPPATTPPAPSAPSTTSPTGPADPGNHAEADADAGDDGDGDSSNGDSPHDENAGGLPYTGVDVLLPIAFGIGLLIVGAVLWYTAVRRRRDRTD